MRLGKPTLAILAFASLTAASGLEERYSRCRGEADQTYSLAWSARCNSLGRPLTCALADAEYRDIDAHHVNAVLSCLDRIRPVIRQANYEAERRRLLRHPLPSNNIDAMGWVERWAVTTVVITLLLGLLIETLRRREQ